VETALAGVPYLLIGNTSGARRLEVRAGGALVAEAELERLKETWRRPLYELYS
jgi:hypothetical protein